MLNAILLQVTYHEKFYVNNSKKILMRSCFYAKLGKYAIITMKINGGKN